MEGRKCRMFPMISLVGLVCVLGLVIAEGSNLSTYIVHVRKPEEGSLESGDLDSWYQSFLPNKHAASGQQQRMVYSYRNVISGFAARLTVEEAQAMKEQHGVLAAKPEEVLSLHTTHTPEFLGLHQGLGVWKDSHLGEGVIIGVLDTGITPNHPSFSDEGVPPPPAKWKGRCDFEGSGCNNKLIGARSFVEGSLPIDELGHGTHTSSTAAGNFVPGANVLGMANGTASGMAPLAHIAMYRVCSDNDCSESSILAAFDAAIEDGVDVLSLSLGGGSSPFYTDSIAIGAFAATQKGIFVSCSAGNGGPEPSTLSNEAPWILTVGASTIDRSIRTDPLLGNGQEYQGESLFQPDDFPSTQLPLVYASANGDPFSAQCLPGSLKGIDLQGKVVVCDMGNGFGRIARGQEVKDNGGAAMILANEERWGSTTLVDDHVLPASQVDYATGAAIKAYINSTSNPTATITFKGTVIGKTTAPAVSFFSSRGPSIASPGILKPDIIGPGVNILAAWPVPLDNNTTTSSTFNIISGTSMSCPHIAGIAALLKSSHPDWSPAAIKSAIMTTADILNLEGKSITDETLNPANIFAMGSGHVNPTKANNPGFVYDIVPEDYISYLCGLGYSDQQVELIVKTAVKCSDITPTTEGELNYPTMTVKLGSSPVTYSRTVRNVGPVPSTYTSVIINPPAVNIGVGPGRLHFTGANQTITYQVTFSKVQGWPNATGPVSQGYLKWVSDQLVVTTPLVVILE